MLINNINTYKVLKEQHRQLVKYRPWSECAQRSRKKQRMNEHSGPGHFIPWDIDGAEAESSTMGLGAWPR